jgi:hypothetical protein
MRPRVGYLSGAAARNQGVPCTPNGIYFIRAGRPDRGGGGGCARGLAVHKPPPTNGEPLGEESQGYLYVPLRYLQAIFWALARFSS